MESPWSVDHVRVTVFPTGGNNEVVPLWKELIGTDPETKSERPQERLVQETGEYLTNQLTITSLPDRVDFRLSASQENLAENETPFFSTFDDALRDFSPFIKKWLRSKPSLNRIALGAVVMSSVKGPAEGYRSLDKFLPDVKVPEWGKSSDFGYSINRRRNSKTSISKIPIEINRLSRWSVMTRRGLGLAFAIDGKKSQIQQIDELKELSFLRLELDINSTPTKNNKPIPVTKLSNIFDELCEFAVEITAYGDLP